MLFWILRPLRFLVQALASEDSPRQLALGFAIGMLIGLVPKGNLVAVGLSLLLLATRVNLAAGTVSAFLFSWMGSLLDPISGHIGWALLSNESLAGFWTTIFAWPLVPWSGLNNTVALGSLVLGLWMFVPLYLVSQPLFARYHSRLVARLRRFRIYHVLTGTEHATRWRFG